jgi:sugar-specific transcriptional regulator TrmB
LASKGFCILLPSKPLKCQAISPKDAIINTKKNIEEKYEKLEKHVLNELEPMFIESKKFIEPKGIFWIINGRANVVKKIDELIQKAKKDICIHCSSNSLSRLILHKELLQEAKNKGIKISIAGVVTKEILDDIQSLNFCDIRKIKNAYNNFISIDDNECLIIEPIPDDDNIVYGRDMGVWVSSPSFTKFMNDLYCSSFKKAKKMNISQTIKPNSLA